MLKKQFQQPEIAYIQPIVPSYPLNIPLVQEYVSAGYPSGNTGLIDSMIDLNKALVKNEATTFFAKVSGESMIGAGIDNGDMLIVDRSLEPQDGKIAIYLINGEFTIKTISIKQNQIFLIPSNENYPVIEVTEDDDLTIWGVVVYVIKEYK